MSEFIRIDQQGRVSAEDDAGQKRLAERAGRYYIAPTSTDLLIGVRAPCTGGQASTPRVILAGDLSGLELADLVAFLNQNRTTGVLRVIAPVGERAIIFRQGEVRGAASDDPADRLGEIAVRLGYVDRARMEKVVPPGSHPTRIGRILVDAGLLQPHDLWKCVQHQVSEIFHAILLSREGAFMLVDQEVEDKGAGLALNTQGLLMDSIRRMDEMREFRKKLPSSRSYVVRRKPADDQLEPQERRIYDLVDGTRTVAEIAQLARLSEFEATKTLHHLVSGGYVAASPTPAGGAARKPPDADETLRVFNFIFKEILSEIRKVGMDHEFVAAANAAIAGQAERTPVIEGASFAADGSLSDSVLRSPLLARMNAREAARTVHAALSELMFFLLFQASDLLDPQADEDLARRVKELLATIEGDS